MWSANQVSLTLLFALQKLSGLHRLFIENLGIISVKNGT